MIQSSSALGRSIRSSLAIAALGVLLSLAACTSPPRQPSAQPGALGSPPPARNGAANYAIDSKRSEVRLLVYRAGPMARLGHNHVILNTGVTGWIHRAAPTAQSSFALEIPTAAFVVDDAAARKEEGADFESSVDDDAKRGTLHNMLSPALLSAESYPQIFVRSAAIRGEEPHLTASIQIEAAGHKAQVEAPVSLMREGDTLVAATQFVLKESDLGIAPFSVMMGALQVRDDFTVKCRLVATRN